MMYRRGHRVGSSSHLRTSRSTAVIARGRPEDLDRTHNMLEQAEDAAGRLGGGLVTGKWRSAVPPSRRLAGSQNDRLRTAGFVAKRSSLQRGPNSVALDDLEALALTT
jgi:hypothetical protein